MSNALQASFRRIILLGRSEALLIRKGVYILGMNTKCNPLTWKFVCKCDPVSGGREREREIAREKEKKQERGLYHSRCFQSSLR
jgi:hypothetical protein